MPKPLDEHGRRGDEPFSPLFAMMYHRAKERAMTITLSRAAPRALTLVLLLSSASHLVAQTAPAPAPRDSRHVGRHEVETVVVTGVRREAADVLGGVSVVSGAELASATR